MERRKRSEEYKVRKSRKKFDPAGAAFFGRIEQLREYLENGGEVDVLVWDGGPIVLGAVTGNQLEVVKMLRLEYNANINIPDENGITPLYRAITNSHSFATKEKRAKALEIAKFLIKNKANLKAMSNNGVSIYEIAKTCEQEEVLSILHQNNIFN